MAYPVYVDTRNKSIELSTNLKYPVGQTSQTTENLEDVEDIALNNNTTMPSERCRTNSSTNNHSEIPLTNEQVSVASVSMIMYVGTSVECHL